MKGYESDSVKSVSGKCRLQAFSHFSKQCFTMFSSFKWPQHGMVVKVTSSLFLVITLGCICCKFCQVIMVYMSTWLGT